MHIWICKLLIFKQPQIFLFETNDLESQYFLIAFTIHVLLMYLTCEEDRAYISFQYCIYSNMMRLCSHSKTYINQYFNKLQFKVFAWIIMRGPNKWFIPRMISLLTYLFSYNLIIIISFKKYDASSHKDLFIDEIFLKFDHTTTNTFYVRTPIFISLVKKIKIKNC